MKNIEKNIIYRSNSLMILNDFYFLNEFRVVFNFLMLFKISQNKIVKKTNYVIKIENKLIKFFL
jgi:hypothetical protein